MALELSVRSYSPSWAPRVVTVPVQFLVYLAQKVNAFGGKVIRRSLPPEESMFDQMVAPRQELFFLVGAGEGDLSKSLRVLPSEDEKESGIDPVEEYLTSEKTRRQSAPYDYDGREVSHVFAIDAGRAHFPRSMFVNGRECQPALTPAQLGAFANFVYDSLEGRAETYFPVVNKVFNQRPQIELRQAIQTAFFEMYQLNPILRDVDIVDARLFLITNSTIIVKVHYHGAIRMALKYDAGEVVYFDPIDFRAEAAFDLVDKVILYDIRFDPEAKLKLEKYIPRPNPEQAPPLKGRNWCVLL